MALVLGAEAPPNSSKHGGKQLRGQQGSKVQVGAVLAALFVGALLLGTPFHASAGRAVVAAAVGALAVGTTAGPPLVPTLEEREYASLPLSSIECDDAPWEQKVCWAHNIYVAGEAAVFVAKDPQQLSLPEARLWEYALQGTAGALQISHVLSVVSEAEAAELFRARSASQPPGGLSDGGRRRLHQSASGGAGSSQEAQAWRFRLLEAAVVLQPFGGLSNWWHAMDDSGSAILRFCKYLGLCLYKDFRATSASVLVVKVDEPLDSVRLSVRQLFSCLGSLRRLAHNVTREQLQAAVAAGAGAGKPPLLVRRALFGVGGEIMNPHSTKGELGVTRANDTMRMGRIQLLRQCVGLPEESPRRQVPIVRIINREYGHGRSIMGDSEILDLLQKSKPAGWEIETRVSFLSNLTFVEQAAVFDQTDVLVIPHGAATASFLFLPRTAVVLNPGAHYKHRAQEEGTATKLPKPWFNVTYFFFDCKGTTEPIISTLKELPDFQRLPDADKVQLLLESRTNNKASYKVIEKLWWRHTMHQFLYYHNMRPPPDQIVPALLRALEVWREKQGGGAR